MNQGELDELSKLLAPLSTDELVVTVVNSRIARNTSPMLAVISFLNLVATLSSLVEEEDKPRIVSVMYTTSPDLSTARSHY